MQIQEKTIDIYPLENKSAPLVLLNSYQPCGGALLQKCRALGCPGFTLAEITRLHWDDDLSPWACPPIREEAPFGGRADDYLDCLLHDILPAVTAALGAEPQAVMLEGYSMAGLFALYAATKCDRFQAVASCSGSLWFPSFKEYMLSCDTATLPKVIYLSLGDREARTRHPLLQTTEDATRAIERHLAANGIRTTFELNKGNHFHQSTLRMAKGIQWMLKQRLQ